MSPRTTNESVPMDWNDIVTVVVGEGPDERKFTAHASALKRIDFFKACLNANIREANDLVIRLPEDDGDVFIAQFRDEIIKRTAVYALARKLCAEKASNDAFDILHEHFLSWFYNADQLCMVFETLDSSDPLWQFFTRMTAMHVKEEGLNKFVTSDETYLLLSDRADYLKFLVEAMAEDLKPKTRVLRDVCAWHTHITTTVCKSTSAN
ncbi:uncharacterized protein AB675_7657 [Cyphellophora attinorum]|uniref:BTB domain-containing protein n=1 Tax=Cyphellophora attinorum TaxID=1664694 RepID=A0A0N1H4X5_9EURO|nr:uncharacterized protein AB675_7657 [Phialophora attinorum]KPI40497.1 hypothetical protein AB675_7657 [Phialophora attinorum]